MAKYFDSVRADPAKDEEERLYRVGQNLPGQLDITQLPVMQADDPAHASRLRRAGFVPGADEGTFQTPSRDPATYMQQVEHQRMLARQKLYDDQRNSTMFKVGDTLADTGRLFLSPLFWLSGEDTTKYDPSAVLESGYRNQLEKSEAYSAALYGKVQQSRTSRLSASESFIKKDADLLYQNYQMKTPNSPEGKAMLDFVRANGQDFIDLYNARTPQAYQALQDEMNVSNGTAFRVGTEGRVMAAPIYNQLTGIAKDWNKTNAKIGEVYNNYNQLKMALSAGSGFGDVAAIFQFMKTLDPDSVVRESEFAVAAGASGLYQQLLVIEKSVGNGDKLSEKARGDMLSLATQLVTTYEDSYEAARGNRERQVRYHQGVTDEDVLNFLGDFKMIEPDGVIGQ